MKKTSEKCFKNETEFMVWQDVNCLQCKKAVFFNVRLNRFPKYRCAVQEQIEGQQLGVDVISQRTFDAVQQKHCPFFVPKVEEKPNDAILDFSRGESLVNVQTPVRTEKTPETKPEAPKTANIPVHDEALEKVARETGATMEQVKAAEKRVLDNIFNGKIVPNLGLRPFPDVERRFKEQMKHVSRQMLETFTFNENMMIAFVPLVISELAWIYARRVLGYCAEHKISDVKKLGRAVKEIQKRYFDELKRDLDAAHIDRIAKQTEEFFQECGRDFTILWFECRGYLLKVEPDLPHMDMRTDAYCCLVMIELLKVHNRRMDKLIASKMGQSSAIGNPQMVALATLMDAYFPAGFKLQPMDTELNVFLNKISKVEFGIED